MDLSEFYTFRGYEILSREKNILTPSMEDYMEMIYRICINEHHVRMNQLAENLNVRTSSSTKIVQKLSKIDLVHYEKYGLISLTEKGENIGKLLYHRHKVIEKFLGLIGVEDTLLKDIELIEHYIRPKLLKNIEQFNQFLEGNQDVLQRYYAYIEKELIQDEIEEKK